MSPDMDLTMSKDNVDFGYLEFTPEAYEAYLEDMRSWKHANPNPYGFTYIDEEASLKAKKAQEAAERPFRKTVRRSGKSEVIREFMKLGEESGVFKTGCGGL